MGVLLTVNVAVTALAALMATMQAPVPEQAPLQPPNVEPLFGVAVSVTLEVLGYDSLQSVPQLMPAGSDVTVPAPVPALVTVRAFSVPRLKVAVTDRAALMVTEQVPVPVQAPLQPVNSEPPPGTAVRVTLVPVS
jgi:hypothetical protein